jgi:tagatose 1,6-diphosphate aldolase GatY/KbaY
MLEKAAAEGYAVGAFNVENMETVQGVVRAAEELGAPVIVQTTPGSVRYAGLRYFAAIVKVAAKAKIPVALHLDHGESLGSCEDAVKADYTSVMIDGSLLSLEENIALTRSTVKIAKRHNVTVEAELGALAGKEDDTVSETSSYTVPSEALRFVKETGINSLAIAVGTAHGVYKTAPVLKIELISEIKSLIPTTPLVLHGASGLSDEMLKECIRRGISKINFATELRIAFSEAVKEYLKRDPAVVDPKKYLSAGRTAVTEIVKAKMLLLGCAGKA